MFRARERGMSFWPFAVSLVVIIVLLVLWYSAVNDRDKAMGLEKQARDDKALAEKKFEDRNARIVKISKAVGCTNTAAAA